MRSFLIVSPDEKKTKEKIVSLANENQAKILNFELKTISQSRELKRIIKLSYQNKLAIVIERVEKASLPALNSILKDIEEARENIIFILTAKSVKSVIPTIVSRCQIVKIKTEKKDNIPTDYSSFISQKMGLNFLQINKIKKREEALEFLGNLIQFCRKDIRQKPKNPKTLRCLIYSSQALSAIRSNGNIKLQLTRMVINL